MTVNIALSPQALKALPAQGALFIAITDGRSSTPVAVKKLPLGHFPVTVTLNDDNAMTPERLLSSLRGGVVSVHLSASGLAEKGPGDWYGQSAVNDFSAGAPIAVTVAQQQ